jgi:hypothetical protein
MLTKICWMLSIQLSLCIPCFPMEPAYFPSIDRSDLPDARFETAKIYTGASLFGYINGGAELFLEYGFSGAWVNQVEYRDGNYTVEIYRMNGPEEAFGIYSVSRFRCQNTPPISPFACQTKYQLQLCSGPFYISIINSTGSSADSMASLKIGEVIAGKIKEMPADITGFLAGVSNETFNREAVLVKGNLGIMNGAPDLADFFGETKGYTALIMQNPDQTTVSVIFSVQESMHRFAAQHNWNIEQLRAISEKMPSGEIVTKISDHHLLIRIKKN